MHHFSRARECLYSLSLAVLLAACPASPVLAQLPSLTPQQRIAQLKDPDPAVREAAAAALLADPKSSVPAILGEMLNVRKESAMLGLINRMGSSAVDPLFDALRHNPELRSPAGRALFGVIGPGDERLAPELLACMKDPEIKFECGRSLVRVMDPKAARHAGMLAEALKDEDRDIRAYAAAALGQIGPKAKKAVPALAELLKDAEAGVRSAAAAALGKLGSAAKGAGEALKAAKNDTNAEVRRAAEAALRAVYE